MEESVTFSDFLEYYKKSMGLEPVDVRTYSPLVLAYIGDAVYELMIRSKVINHGSMQVNKMHKHSAALVKASAHAQLIKALQEELTEEELAAYKRGRNAKSATMAKHATMIDYLHGHLGLEALVGWLFLTEQYARLVELVSRGLVKAGLLEPWVKKEKQKDEIRRIDHRGPQRGAGGLPRPERPLTSCSCWTAARTAGAHHCAGGRKSTTPS